jgi:hypothetical protein
LGLLDAGLEEIGGLEEDGRCEAGTESGGEVEDGFGCFGELLAKVAVLADAMHTCGGAGLRRHRYCAAARHGAGLPRDEAEIAAA